MVYRERRGRGRWRETEKETQGCRETVFVWCRERERDRDRQTDRQTGRQAGRQAET